MTSLRVVRLRCEHLEDPLGIDTPTPRLSWQVRCPRRGAAQHAYRLLAASSPELLADGVGDLWDSGRVESDDCVLVPYEGQPLRSRQRAYWSVSVWDDENEMSSPAAGSWEMGLLDAEDWQAAWVAAPAERTPQDEGAVSYLRSRLHLDAPVRRARAYVTALGVYELHCNGQRVGRARFTPGWTDYAQRLQYQVLDLTDLLQPGDNAIGAVLADGWYAGYIGFLGQREHYGDTPQLLVQVEVETDEGTVTHSTGPRWSVGDGPIRSSDMLRGESVDLRLADPDWCRPVPGKPPWPAVRVTAGTSARRVVSPAPPVAVIEELTPVGVTRLDACSHRVDLGQNVVGWLRLRLGGAPGTVVTVRHAEALEEDGSLHTANLRAATATDRYVLGSGDPCTLEPTFTFHGFRYAEVSGVEGELTAEDVTGVVCGSDLEQVGEFSCSDARVDQLHANIVRSARGNFLDVPTDCPQRDERLGWTGDAQVFAPTACYLFDMAAFFTKWLRDLGDTQTPDGSFGDVAPRVVLGPEGSAGWADAGVLVPWTVFAASGDRRLLEQTYPAMRRWVDYVAGANPELLWLQARGYDNGDWLAPHSVTDKDLIATAFFARSTRVTARVADILGLAGDATELHELANRVTAAFQRAYLLDDGRLSCETQTAYALALRFELLPLDARAEAGRRLAADVEAHDHHLTTGFLGIAHLLPALSDAGRHDLAYRLLLAQDYPSWLHSVAAGATTIWERWDGWTAAAGFGDPEMNSFNHYAFGAIGEWLYRTVGGIHLEPGGGRVVIAPYPDDRLTWARARHLGPRGQVVCAWSTGPGNSLEVRIEVPVGVTARVRLPAAPDDAVLVAGASLSAANDVVVSGRDATCVWLETGSGEVAFSVSPV